MKFPGFDTISLHGGQRPDPATGARAAAPIYQTTSFVFKETDQASSMFDIAPLRACVFAYLQPDRGSAGGTYCRTGGRHRAP